MVVKILIATSFLYLFDQKRKRIKISPRRVLKTQLSSMNAICRAGARGRNHNMGSTKIVASTGHTVPAIQFNGW